MQKSLFWPYTTVSAYVLVVAAMGFPFIYLFECDSLTDRQTSDCTVAPELKWQLVQRSCWLKSIVAGLYRVAQKSKPLPTDQKIV